MGTPGSAAILSSLFFGFFGASVMTARAEPFTVLSDGSLVFNAAFTSAGVFTCGAVVPCSGSGTSSVTMGSGPESVTLTFTGVNTTVPVGNIATPVSLGSFEASASSPAFTFPAHPNPNVPILRFDFSMVQSSPVPATGGLIWFFGPGGGMDLPLLMGGSYIGFPAGSNPPGFNYTGLVYSISPFPLRLRGDGVTDMGADAGAVPEPATMFLVGAGLAAAAYGRRRKRRSRCGGRSRE